MKMHPVIQHLKKRADKSVPVKDGRKISLVLFGGAMTGVRGAGAMIALEDMGFTHSFDQVYTISSGFPNGTGFLAGQARMVAAVYYEDLATRKFINFLRLWKMVDVDYFIHVLSTVKVFDMAALFGSKTKLWVQLQNCTTKEIEFKELHSMTPDTFLDHMKAATGVQYFYHRKTKIGDSFYRDPPFFGAVYLHNNIQKALDDGSTDILIVCNHDGQYQAIKPLVEKYPEMIYTITPPKEWKLSRFEKNTHVLLQAAVQMGTLVKEEFLEKGGIDLTYESRNRPGTHT